MPEVAYSQLAELKIPARGEFIGVAKRVATSLGGQLGFGLEELDELAIAVVQACSNAIQSAQRSWGAGATLKLSFFPTDRGIAVEVEAAAPRSQEALAVRRAASAPPPAVPGRSQEVDMTQALANEMIRLFVDDFRHQVDARRRQIRFRMVKYLVSG